MVKLHINPTNKNLKIVRDFLANSSPYRFKGPGASGQEDKKFTIYIGSLDDAIDYATYLDEEVGHLLSDEPVWSDLKISGNVYGRFEVEMYVLTEYYTESLDHKPVVGGVVDLFDVLGVDECHHKYIMLVELLGYGLYGISPLKVDDIFDTKSRKERFEIINRAHKLYKGVFGEFYDGKGGKVTKYLNRISSNI